ncbi:hypothetical protein L6270_04740 [Candidatus Parcubacteria bacterium]|nr:hypothetical protein [Patescibacteria group bacterium]MBU4309268.1 hypothetical protein [Patescibacteria group bacterium]MBU4432497.1 hypothetical protein [Patescibacteria group bacterium]MBU4577629.1 hypothetical protein [Patescibacteria group bacterium]MCG2697315.1 hypothetical protein [Candidatus Parcubacteria bacterium]
MLKDIYKKQEGVIAIAMTLLILASIIVIVIISNTIILNNLGMNISQVDAVKAFYAGEAGVEKILWGVRKNSFDFTVPGSPCNVVKKKIKVSTSGCDSIGEIITLTGNNSTFSLEYDYTTPTTTITSIGSYNKTGRNIEIRY